MKEYYRILIFTSLLGGSLLSSPVNNIDEDPWLRTWLFVGPFENYETAEKASDSLSKANFNDIVKYCDGKETLKHHTITSSSSTGRHAVYQYFPNSNEKFVIGFCLIQSRKNENVFFNQFVHPWDQVSFYLNDDLITENSSKSNGWVNTNLKSGTNIGRVIFRLIPDAIAYNPNSKNDLSLGIFKKKFLTTLKGKVTYKKSPINKVSINIATTQGLVSTLMSDENGRFETRVINQFFDENLFLYLSKDNLKYSSLLKVNKSNRDQEIEIELKNYPDSINGRVFTLFEDKPQSDVLVKLLDKTNNKVTSKVFSDNSGSFEFQKVPTGIYQVFIEADGIQYFAEEENGEVSKIVIGKSNKSLRELRIKAPQVNKGLWEQVNFIKGLSSDYVHDIYVDNQNKIWYGCHTGLTVYDGNKYRKFGIKEGLSGTSVIKIFEDSGGLIWIIERNEWNSSGGIKTIDSNYRIENFLEKYKMKDVGFSAISEDNEGNIIFGGHMGLFIFNGKEIRSMRYGDGLGSGHITDIFIDNDNYWLGTTDGLVHFNGSVYNNHGINEGLGANAYIRKISKSPKGDLLITTGHPTDFEDSGSFFTSSMYSYDGVSFNVIERANHTSNINDILFSSNIMYYNSNDKVILHSENSQQSISPFWSKNTPIGFAVRCFERTKEGNIIIGTIGGGAWKYDAKSVNTISRVDGFPDGWAWNMIADNEKNIWAATNSGILKVNDVKIIRNYNKNSGFPAESVSDVDLDNFGNIWASTSDGFINIVGEKILVYDKDDGLLKTDLNSLSISSRGKVWVGTAGVLSSFDGTKVKNFSSNVDSIRIFGGNAGLYALDNGDVLFGGSGLNIFEPNKEQNKFTRLTQSEWVNDITQDNDGNIIYSSVNEGVVRFKDGIKIDVYNSENGLLFDQALSVYVDENNWIWATSESGGVGFFDGYSWSYLNKEDGILENRVHRVTSDNAGTYYLSHVGGITVYKPQKQKGFVSIDKVSTTKLDYTNFNNQTIESIINERIRISFVARNHNSSKNKFKCTVLKDGEELITQVIDNPYFEWYPDMTGEFELSVQSIDRDLNYSNPKVLTISILNPWYIRSSFLIPFLGFLTVILYTAYYAMSKFIKQKEFNEKLRLNAQQRDKEARIALEEKNKDLVESQKAAEAANEAKSTFLANMSHELRTPLNAIIGYSEMLIEDAEDENEDFIPDLDKINTSGKHLLGLINDILDLSKVESGKMELFIEEFELEKVLKEVVSTITPLVEKNNNTLNLSIKTKTKNISADITKIRQIMLNLLSNATKFTKEGEISIIVNDNADNQSLLDFKVSDSGIGMTQDQVDKVFKPFTQADEKTTRKFGGTGLGLTITKMFAEMMGGGINLTSVINKGTTFTVSIPKIVIDPKNLKDKIDEVTLKADEGTFSILVIDDDPNAQELMKKFLLKENYKVLQATSGHNGLNLAAKHIPDLITLDVMMPEMDGWEVLTALQNNETTKNIPVIMLTMANEPDIGYSLGATDYLTKPVDWGRLSRILEKHEIETSSQSILIVEDDEITRDMLKKSLETNEFKVSVAKNGKEGLERVKKAKPALILLDLMMPEMDGFQFAEELRENKEWLDIPVVVITAKDLTSEDHNRLKGNVEAIMQKGSYTRDELLSEVGHRIKKLKERI